MVYRLSFYLVFFFFAIFFFFRNFDPTSGLFSVGLSRPGGMSSSGSDFAGP